MKKKQSFFTVGLVILILLALNGCGSAAPDQKLIEGDLLTELNVQYGQGYELTSYEIVQSITEGNTHVATIAVAADGIYAHLDVTVEMQYTKYDQGWQNDYIVMWTDSYEIINYPSFEELAVLCEQRNSISDWEITYTDAVFTPSYVAYNGYIDTEFNDFFKVTAYATTYWTFSLENNEWVFESEDIQYNAEVTFNMEGSWKVEGGAGSRIKIRNQTADSMEICLTSVSDEWVYVEVDSSETDISTYSLSNGGPHLIYTGTTADSKKVTVDVHTGNGNRLCVNVDHQYRTFDSHAYSDTIKR